MPPDVVDTRFPANRKRFALLAPNYFPLTCGVGDHSMRLALELRRRGHDAVVFTHAPAGPNPEAPDVPVVGVPGRLPTTIAAHVGRAVVDGGFSHVILQYTAQMWGASRLGSPALPMLAAFLAQRGLPVTLVMHELYTPWKARPDLALGAGLMRAQLGALMISAKALFVTTGSRRHWIEAAAGALSPERPIDVLPISPAALPVAARRPPGRHRMGLFSTLAVGKSFDVVVDAFDEVTRTHPDAELVLIGDLGSPTGARHRALMQRISSSPAAARITVTGKMSLGAIAEAVADLDVYLFPMTMGATTRSSTLPVALGAGLPVVAISGLETDARFVHGDNVYFARGLDGASFAQATLEIFADRAIGDRLAAGAAHLYREQLSWPTITDAIMGRL